MGVRLSPLAVLLVVLLAAAAGPAAGRGSRRRLLVPPTPAAAKQPAPAQHPVPPEFTITNATLGGFLKRLASPNEHAVVFTTTRCARCWARTSAGRRRTSLRHSTATLHRGTPKHAHPPRSPAPLSLQATRQAPRGGACHDGQLLLLAGQDWRARAHHAADHG